MPLSITVVVCTRDRPLQLQACLAALSAQSYPRFDVLVVDNACVAPVDDICRRARAVCIYEPVPGLTRARNLGARVAQGDLVAYIDDDAIAEPGWLEALAREFADPAVAAVAGRTRYMRAAGDSLDMTDEPVPDDGGVRPRRVFDRRTEDWFLLACFGGIGDGNTMAFRREFVANGRRFDERLGRGRLLEGADEHVAFMSLIAEGHRVAYAPDGVVRHPYPAEPGLVRARRLRDLRNSVAYLLFLWFEFPCHRVALLRFVLRAVGKRLPGGGARRPARPGLPLRRASAAAFAGIRTYLKARREWMRAGPRSEQDAATGGAVLAGARQQAR